MLREREVIGKEDEVMNEVHLGCPPGFSSPYISRFTFSIPANSYYCTIGLGGERIAGIILSRIARIVFLTDSDDIILENCAANVHLNSNSFNCFDASVIKKLDWKKSWPPTTEIKDLKSSGRYTYSWTSAEIEEAEGASLVLAGDVIYSDELTDSFFSVLEILMSKRLKPHNKVLYMALEKRYNFSLDDVDVVANGYSHFRSFLMVEGCNNKREGGSHLLGEKLGISEVPQYIKEYDRGEDLEFWKITYEP